MGRTHCDALFAGATALQVSIDLAVDPLGGFVSWQPCPHVLDRDAIRADVHAKVAGAAENGPGRIVVRHSQPGPAREILCAGLLDLSGRAGFLRVFDDLGKPVQVILRRLSGQGHSVETIRRILEAFPQDDHQRVSSESLAPPAPHLSPSNATLTEPLTPRELEVLSLLRGPLSIKEIAQKLNISHATARRHTINIYGKLGVDQRWSAVTRAEELYILSPR